MISGVTRHMLPDLSGVPHLRVNRPLIGTSGSDNGDSEGNIAAEIYPFHPLKLFRDSCKRTSSLRREIRLELKTREPRQSSDEESKIYRLAVPSSSKNKIGHLAA